MAPGIALDILSNQSNKIRVLDPMMGSGTVLAMARASGHSAIGVDIDPLAVLLARVWTTAADPTQIRSKAAQVLERAKNSFCSRTTIDAYPLNADIETRRFVRYWFDDYARKQLASLASAIHGVRDNRTRDTLWCAFSRLIITKQAGASLAMDLSHSRPHKAFDRAPIKPFNKFLAAVDHVLKNSVSKHQPNRGPATQTFLGDARKLQIASGTIDLVLTSPPYLNAIDYMRCSKFSLVWMGYAVRELSGIRTDSVGTERGDQQAYENEGVREIISELRLSPKLSFSNEVVLAHYIEDMWQAVKEVSRVLSPNGRAVYVVGENTVRGTFIPNAKIVSAVAERSGLVLERRHARSLPANRRYLPPPNARSARELLDGRMRREVILSFSRS
jgi:DNA modification methylase